jgi:hypothetical protein
MRVIEDILLIIIAIWMIPIMPVIYLLSKIDDCKDDSPIC